MTCQNGFGNCDYPKRRCEQNAACQFMVERNNPTTGLNSNAFRYFPYFMVIGGLVMVYILHRVGVGVAATLAFSGV